MGVARRCCGGEEGSEGGGATGEEGVRGGGVSERRDTEMRVRRRCVTYPY